MHGQPARNEVELRMAEALVDCAYPLTKRLGEAANAEPDHARMLALSDAFLRGFQAVRLGIRLSMALRSGRSLAPPAREERDEPEAERFETERPDRLEREPADDPPDRERDRDYEPVSPSRFLSTLRRVAADAHRLPTAADPAALAKLEALLAQVDAPSPAPVPAANVMLRARPPAPPPKARLLGSAVTLVGRRQDSS